MFDTHVIRDPPRCLGICARDLLVQCLHKNNKAATHAVAGSSKTLECKLVGNVIVRKAEGHSSVPEKRYGRQKVW